MYQYESGSFGYGHAKQAVEQYRQICSDKVKFNNLMDKPKQMDQILQQGAIKHKRCKQTLKRSENLWAFIDY